SPIIEINLERKEIKTASGARQRFDYLISTIPLPDMPQLIKGMPKKISSFFKKLRWNSIFNLNLGVEKSDTFRRHWIYFPQKIFCFYRVGCFHNFYQPSLKQSSYYIEVAYSKDKPIDKSHIVQQIKKDLEKAGILSKKDKILAQEINDIKYGYPIYDANYKETRENILKFLILNNVILCGRYGSWRYLSMEDTILDGKLIADML
ncbi:MAG: FAD-dependent oxidoreductase, partial [Candidatus Omnitrophica bacterium]|nr:FAD-dependent oxidoreductase [Candidatus Omnitrophota bacterium]